MPLFIGSMAAVFDAKAGREEFVDAVRRLKLMRADDNQAGERKWERCRRNPLPVKGLSSLVDNQNGAQRLGSKVIFTRASSIVVYHN